MMFLRKHLLSAAYYLWDGEKVSFFLEGCSLSLSLLARTFFKWKHDFSFEDSEHSLFFSCFLCLVMYVIDSVPSSMLSSVWILPLSCLSSISSLT